MRNIFQQHFGRTLKAVCLLSFVMAVAGLAWPAPARVAAEATYPPGFAADVVVGGLNMPTAITWAPDGRMYIAQKGGVVRVFQNGALVPGSFIDLSAEVNDYWDRGLLGLALHPDFPATPYVYLLYTYDPPGAAKDGNGERVSRLIRVSANPDNLNTALPNSAVVVLGKNSTLENIGDEALQNGLNENETAGPASCDDNGKPIPDCLASDGHTHSIGTVAFGNDGMLFVSNGEGSETSLVDPRALRAQNLDSLGGKILRIDPITGNGLSDNPFYDGDPTSNRSKVWAYGLRNPYRVAIHPVTSEPFIGDVGWNSWEEANTGRGKNFGWPCYEGNDARSNRQPAYQADPLTEADCATLYDQGLNVVEAPLYAFFHVNDQAAMIMGDFYRGTTYPAEYKGALFFADYNADLIKYLTFDAAGKAAVHDFGTDVSPDGAPVQITSGPDTDLYFVVLNEGQNGEVRRIRYGEIQPTPQVTPTVTVGSAPVVTIESPKNGDRYSVGDTIQLSGTAQDAEDGALAGGNLQWTISLRHNDHLHPDFLSQTGPKGSIVAPNHGDNTAMQVCLVATDSDERIASSCVDLLPNTVAYTFESRPSGLELVYEGVAHVTPFTVETIVNAQQLVIAPATQQNEALIYNAWSDGGERSHAITIGQTPQTYTVTYIPNPAGPATQAASPTPTSTASSTTTIVVAPAQEVGEIVSFSTLGLGESVLRGPFDELTFSFSPPASWAFTEGAEFHLDTLTFFSNAIGTPAPGPSNEYAGSVEITLNDNVLGTLLIDQLGERTDTIPISVEALNPVRADGRHELTIKFDGSTTCENPQQASVIIHPTSLMILPHELVAPSTDLRRLPRPIFQDAFVPDTALIIVPAQPTAEELRAALAVVAGFGEMTKTNLGMTLIPVDQLTPQLQALHHLIFVGMPGAFPMLDEVAWPSPVQESLFAAIAADSDDGVIQMAVSPWNNAKAVLVAGGHTEAGVIKAAQALSTGVIRIGDDVSISIVTAVRPTEGIPAVPVDQTFADLGYDDRLIKRIGDNATEYLFYVPPGQDVEGQAYVDLVFNHSTLLDYQISGMTVELNKQPVGSTRFSNETANNGNLRITLPGSLMQPGINRLSFLTDLAPENICNDPRGTRLWLTYRADSLLHLPLTPSTQVKSLITDLSEYPRPYIFSKSLNNTAFILPPDNPASWDTAAQIAFDLGDETGLTVAELLVAYADNVPDDIRQDRHLIIVGRPSQLPIIAELGDALPAPFEAGQEVAVEPNSLIVFALSPDTGVGYVQLLASPWNNSRAIIAVLGNTDQAVQLAGSTLFTSRLRVRLAGNLVVINDQQIVASDTRLNDGGVDVVATQIAAAANQPQVEPGLNAGRPGWIVPLLIISILAMIGLIAYVVTSARKQQTL